MKKIIAKSITTIASVVLLYFVIYFAGKGFMTKELALGLFIAVSIVVINRGFDLVEMIFIGNSNEENVPKKQI